MADSLDIILGEDFLTWLWFRTETSPDLFRNGDMEAIYLEQHIVAHGGEGQSRETISVSGQLSPLREAKLGLATGKKVARALIRLEKSYIACSFTLKAEDFALSGFRVPKTESEGEVDRDAALLDKIFIIESCLQTLDNIYARFLRLRLSPQWQSEIAEMGSWLRQDL